MYDHLPLAQLQAFEAAARALSFTAAARKLNVQQPAISRQINALETALGTVLFKRTKPHLTLTPEGAQLFETVRQVFADLRSTLGRIQDSQSGPSVVVNAAIGFTSQYLMPRLNAFQKAHPDHRVEIVTRDQNTGFDDAADLVVTFGAQGLAGTRSAPIFKEELCAICAPSYLPGGHPVSLHELASQKLLHLSSDDHRHDWARFFAGTGLPVPPVSGTDRMMSYMVYLTAVQDGQGIGLGWSHLISKTIREGRLVLACDRVLQTDRAYHANLTRRAEGNIAAEALWSWLISTGSNEDGLGVVRSGVPA